MPDEREIDSPLEEKKKESNGEFLVRVLKPFGCFLVLAIMVLYFIICFTYKSTPPAKDAPAQTETVQAADPGK